MTEKPTHASLMADSTAYRLHNSDLTVDGQPYSLTKYPYACQILDQTPRRMSILKGAQLGITVTCLAKCTERARLENLRSILYVFPSADQVIDFSKARMGPWLENELYSKYRSKVDSSALRQIAGTNLYFRAGGVRGTAGTQSLANVKSIPADMLVEDESDEIEQSRRSALRHRLDNPVTDTPCHIDLSTPTIPGYGIDIDYQASDGRRWFWKCFACNDYTCLEQHFPDCIAEPREGEPYYLCMSCGEPLKRHKGRWIAERPEIVDHRGYALSQMCGLNRTAGQILEEYELAEDSVRPGAVREFYNQVLGRPYAEIEDQLTDAAITECVDTDRPRQKRSRGPCAMGVDPGAREMHYVIGDRVSATDTRVLDWGKVSGFDEIGQLSERFHVQTGVMDQGAESRMVREFVDKRPAWYGCHYSEGRTAGYDWKPRDSHVTVNRTEALDAAHQAVLRHRVRFPAKDEVFHETISPQLKNLARIELRNDQTGDIRHRWVVTGGVKNDHIAHAHAYFQIACENVGLAGQVERARRGGRKRERKSFMGS